MNFNISFVSVKTELKVSKCASIIYQSPSNSNGLLEENVSFDLLTLKSTVFCGSVCASLIKNFEFSANQSNNTSIFWSKSFQILIGNITVLFTKTSVFRIEVIRKWKSEFHH